MYQQAPVVSITRAVKFNITKVSINTSIIAAKPYSEECFTFAMAWACGVNPIPASFENKPLATPYLTASFTVAPITPPITAEGLNAPTNIILNAGNIFA